MHAAFALGKKFQPYNAGCVLMDRVARDAHLLREIGARFLRVDGGMGWDTASKHMPGAFGSVVEATPGGGIGVDSSAVANYTDILDAQEVRPVYSWAYTPTPLQPPNGSWNSGPRNLTLWNEVHRKLAESLKGTGAVFELYNEPDLSWALTAPWPHYLDMYAAAAKGVRAGDPAARIIGPAMALYPTNSTPEHKKLATFLAFVGQNKLPMDALSIHAYGAANWRTHLRVARQALKSGPPSLAKTPIQLTEINVVDTTSPHAVQRAELNNYTIAAAMLSMIAELNRAVDVELVYWAQFQEPGADVATWGGPWGMVDMEGNVKASFNALAIYHRMPVAATGVDVGQGLGAMASSNASRASLVVWSTDAVASLSVQLFLAGVPFSHGRLTVYRIDSTHASYGNSRDPAAAALAPEQLPVGQTRNMSWVGQLHAKAVVYLELNAVSVAPSKKTDDNVNTPSTRVLYMRCDGSDRHSGQSDSVAVRTLTRVHALVRELILADPKTDIEIHAAPGTYRSNHYYDYRSKWPSNDTMEDATITFMPAPAPTQSSMAWPVTFDGCATATGPCPGGTFFDLFFSRPKQDGSMRVTNLVFRGLHLTNFSQGIIFTGCEVFAGGHCQHANVSHHEHNMNGLTFAISGNTVRDCFFERMGNVFNQSLCPCCGAIATVHAHDSLFTGNTCHAPPRDSDPRKHYCCRGPRTTHYGDPLSNIFSWTHEVTFLGVGIVRAGSRTL
jgi:hypothetical protein